MLKNKVCNLADSNIANLGSDLDMKCRLEKSKMETQWKNAGKAQGIEIWRVEQFKIVPIPKQTYGTFFSGDSYIVLKTSKKANGNALSWDVHFWLGENTTQDEAGTAAYKTVELDDFLQGSPVQHREVQGHESNLFLGYFSPGIKILQGGVDSGFNHVKPTEYKPRLLHMKGKRRIRVSQVPLELSSMNHGDCFILDLGLKVIQWNGSESGALEKNKAAQITRSLDDERGSVDILVIDDGGETDDFWAVFGETGPKPELIKSASEGGADIEVKSVMKVLLQVSDASGTIEMKEIAKDNAVRKELLSSDDVFILDTGTDVFAWVGLGSSALERKNALSFAHKYLVKYNRPLYTPISRILEGGENEVFNQAFC